MSSKIRNILDQPLLSLTAFFCLTLRMLVEGGTLITGGLGSGKSSTSLYQLIMAMFRAGLGALLCTVKSEDAGNYLAYAKAAGRESDVIVFSLESGLSFDPLAYLWNNGRGASDVEAIIDFFSTILSIGKQHVGASNDRFWELASEQAIRHSLHLLKLAREPISIISIHKTISSFPSRPEQHEEASWLNSSYTASLINKIRERKDTLSAIEWADLEVATEFVFYKWPNLDEKPRSSIEMTFSGMADKFLFSPFREMFCSGTYSFTPEQVTHEHKIIILDIPVLELGRENARLMQIIVKLVFQRAWLRHPYKPGCCNGAMLVQDEFENHFVQVCRSSAIAPIFITQTILNLAEEMGESQPGPKTKAILNNLSIKIAHNSTCPETCNYLSDVIGKTYRYLDNYSAGSSGDNQSHTNIGGSRQLAYIVEPITFSQLARPDGESPYAAAIVYCGGRTFSKANNAQNARGDNYLHVHFSRE
jgi:type IV secretory pathway TraG/TraD family ATPase VirD4